MPSGAIKKEIDWNIVDDLMRCHCTGTEIAARLGISPDTLYRRVKEDFKVDFAVYIQQKREDGKTLLRKLQFDTAFGKVNERYDKQLKETVCICEPNTAMQIFLGKQYLDQSDKQENKNINNNFDFSKLTNEELESKLQELLNGTKTADVSYSDGTNEPSE